MFHVLSCRSSPSFPPVLHSSLTPRFFPFQTRISNLNFLSSQFDEPHLSLFFLPSTYPMTLEPSPHFSDPVLMLLRPTTISMGFSILLLQLQLFASVHPKCGNLSLQLLYQIRSFPFPLLFPLQSFLFLHFPK